MTLIEVVIALAVVGLLVAVALPSYMSHVAKGRRTDARIQMVAAQQWLERIYSEGYTYATIGQGGTAIGTALAAQSFAKSPVSGTANYRLTITVPTDGQSFTLRATRQAGSPMASDACGDFTLDHLGTKGIASGTFGSTYATAEDAAKDCWGG
jgi:type IV pilus assembly protein PilE